MTIKTGTLASGPHTGTVLDASDLAVLADRFRSLPPAEAAVVLSYIAGALSFYGSIGTIPAGHDLVGVLVGAYHAVPVAE